MPLPTILLSIPAVEKAPLSSVTVTACCSSPCDCRRAKAVPGSMKFTSVSVAASRGGSAAKWDKVGLRCKAKQANHNHASCWRRTMGRGF